jgi:hypothetical protein
MTWRMQILGTVRLPEKEQQINHIGSNPDRASLVRRFLQQLGATLVLAPEGQVEFAGVILLEPLTTPTSTSSSTSPKRRRRRGPLPPTTMTLDLGVPSFGSLSPSTATPADKTDTCQSSSLFGSLEDGVAPSKTSKRARRRDSSSKRS